MSVLLLTVLALFFGLGLGYTAIRFRVEGNPIVEKIDALLPQTQCGQMMLPWVVQSDPRATWPALTSPVPRPVRTPRPLRGVPHTRKIDSAESESLLHGGVRSVPTPPT